MSDKTNIEWTDSTWNPIRGCSRVSEGCRNCYAERVAARFSGPGQPYEGLARRTAGGEARWIGQVRLVETALEQPPQVLRRSFNTLLKDGGITPEAIQAMMGHARDGQMTERYYYAAESVKRAAVVDLEARLAVRR